jgi:UPF0271 protein
MTIKNKKKVFVLDTSALLSGKPIDIKNSNIVTSNKIRDELKPGGRDYQSFQFLIEKGLVILSPSVESVQKIKKISTITGDIGRLSEVDIELLALALDIKKKKDKPIIVTDDYSIQNVSYELKIDYANISEPGITKKFIWITRCRGCGKRFKENITKCPICGSETKKIIVKKEKLE